jgi:hypothetical protein
MELVVERQGAVALPRRLFDLWPGVLSALAGHLGFPRARLSRPARPASEADALEEALWSVERARRLDELHCKVAASQVGFVVNPFDPLGR